MIFRVKKGLEKQVPNNRFDDLVFRADAARDRLYWKEAEECYGAALALRPEADHLWMQRGHALKELRQFQAAEDCYRLFFLRHPDDADVHLQFGHLFALQDRFDEAKIWYERAFEQATAGSSVAEDAKFGIKICTDQPFIKRRSVALDLVERGQFEEAYRIFSVLVLEDGFFDLELILGNCCKETGRFAEAKIRYLAYLGRFYSDKARLCDAEMQLGHLAKIERRYNDALGHFIRVKELLNQLDDSKSFLVEVIDEVRQCLAEVTKAFEV